MARADGQLRLEFSVQDTGIGISPAHQEQLFQGFTQAEASISRRFGGDRAGLAICKRLVELMDGQLQVVESEWAWVAASGSMPPGGGQPGEASWRRCAGGCCWPTTIPWSARCWW